MSLAVKAPGFDPARRADVAHGVQAAIVDTLVTKALRALEATASDTLVVAGGVGANRALREALAAAAARRGARVHWPRIEFCTDNAAMIAVAGFARLAPANTRIFRSRRGRNGRSRASRRRRAPRARPPNPLPDPERPRA